MATLPNPLEEALHDLEFPQREAAFFYGLFLRGHSAEELRRDIEVPMAVLAKWDRESEREPELRPRARTHAALSPARSGNFREPDLPRRRNAETSVVPIAFDRVALPYVDSARWLVYTFFDCPYPVRMCRSPVAQWQSIRLLTEGLLVRV